MGKKKLEDTVSKGAKEQVNNFYNEINGAVSEMLRLTKIIAPDVTVETVPPKINRELFGVRADAIDLVESATYANEYTYNQYEAEYQRTRSIYDYGFFRQSTWWIPQSTAPCVKITLAGGAEYLIEGTLEEILELVDKAS